MGRSVSTWILLVAFILAASITQNAVADEIRPGVSELCNQLYDAKTAPTAARALLARGKESLPLLLGIVGERGDDIAARGWAMSILAHHKDTDAVPFLHRSLQDSKEQPIVRLWAARSLLILGHPHLVLRMSQNGQTEITLRNALTTTLSESGPEIGPGGPDRKEATPPRQKPRREHPSDRLVYRRASRPRPDLVSTLNRGRPLCGRTVVHGRHARTDQHQ